MLMAKDITMIIPKNIIYVNYYCMFNIIIIILLIKVNSNCNKICNRIPIINYFRSFKLTRDNF